MNEPLHHVKDNLVVGEPDEVHQDVVDEVVG